MKCQFPETFRFRDRSEGKFFSPSNPQRKQTRYRDEDDQNRVSITHKASYTAQYTTRPCILIWYRYTKPIAMKYNRNEMIPSASALNNDCGRSAGIFFLHDASPCFIRNLPIGFGMIGIGLGNNNRLAAV